MTPEKDGLKDGLKDTSNTSGSNGDQPTSSNGDQPTSSNGDRPSSSLPSIRGEARRLSSDPSVDRFPLVDDVAMPGSTKVGMTREDVMEMVHGMVKREVEDAQVEKGLKLGVLWFSG